MADKPQPFHEYAGYASREMRLRAIEAGCETVAEMADWLDRWYGKSSQREMNRDWPPGKFRREPRG